MGAPERSRTPAVFIDVPSRTWHFFSQLHYGTPRESNLCSGNSNDRIMGHGHSGVVILLGLARKSSLGYNVNFKLIVLLIGPRTLPIIGNLHNLKTINVYEQ
ncbi:hypothetical protein AG1IA_08188 [Rhizoctonia solani AG-1 IA]|uniref:Uncharacterized protein n=1 Tax=Thanatephorus cucumeris (strain AG1-IA) TaxID=983506 RepID=L8WIS8_THACA|nr:hypothetical protein AG1IA_08188 [Rhizoctonia solani AG-1 IA]